MITRKVCLLGAFGVGKTSLVRRFVEGVFDERYVTTLGVKIDTKTVDTGDGDVKLIIWDMEGADPDDDLADPVNDRVKSYLTGADGVLLVIDGTRRRTFEVARDMLAWLAGEASDIPALVLVNKSDLADRWQVAEDELVSWAGPTQWFTTSALSGDNVERTFGVLAAKLIEGT